MYTTVSYARVTKALSEVVRGLKVWEQERVDAMAQAINDAIDALVSTTEYDAILATCLAVNNDTIHNGKLREVHTSYGKD